MAQAVLTAIQGAVPGYPPLQRRHVWLAEAPLPTLRADVWLVVSLAALTAMETGRKRLTAAALAAREADSNGDGLRQTLITDFFERLTPAPTPPPPPTPLQAAVDTAVMQFWLCLHNFAHLGLAAQGSQRAASWVSMIPATHPLLAVRNGRLVVVCGPAAGV